MQTEVIRTMMSNLALVPGSAPGDPSDMRAMKFVVLPIPVPDPQLAAAIAADPGPARAKARVTCHLFKMKRRTGSREWVVDYDVPAINGYAWCGRGDAFDLRYGLTLAYERARWAVPHDGISAFERVAWPMIDHLVMLAKHDEARVKAREAEVAQMYEMTRNPLRYFFNLGYEPANANEAAARKFFDPFKQPISDLIGARVHVVRDPVGAAAAAATTTTAPKSQTIEKTESRCFTGGNSGGGKVASVLEAVRRANEAARRTANGATYGDNKREGIAGEFVFNAPPITTPGPAPATCGPVFDALSRADESSPFTKLDLDYLAQRISTRLAEFERIRDRVATHVSRN